MSVTPAISISREVSSLSNNHTVGSDLINWLSRTTWFRAQYLMQSNASVDPHWTPYLGPLIESGIAQEEVLSSAADAAGDSIETPRSSQHESSESQVDKSLLNPCDVKNVNVSGRVILAITNPPHKIVTDSQGKPHLKPRGGNSALYSSISYIIEETKWDPILVSWPGEWGRESDTEQCSNVNEAVHEDLEHKLTEATGCTVKPVWMDTHGADSEIWNMYALNVIWPTLHYIQGDGINSDMDGGNQEKEWWKNYIKLNESYRDRILEVYRPGDIIWVHDFYLLLLPQLLRMALPQATIGLFVHAPFPSSEYFRCIPQRNQLLEGMLGANLVSFQSPAYCRHFISSCTRLLGVESAHMHEISAFGVHVSIEALPIGIDTKKVESDAFQPGILEKVQAIRDLYPDKKIIVGRDRLDSVRGVVQKLQAFEMFLHMYPEWHQKVVLIQVTSPSHSVASKVETKVSDLVFHINGAYGELNFSPVHHYPQHIAKDEYLALLRVADLGLITSVRDGMNTTSLEFVVCQKENHSPIILSEFTGTATNLQDAIQVNPWDALEVAETINNSLKLADMDPLQNKEREDKLYKYVTTHTVQDWVSQFMRRLTQNVAKHSLNHVTPLLDQEKVYKNYQNASQRLFLFDYDGTLTPIVKEPSAAIPSSKLYTILDALCADPKNVVWIISGRDQQFLDTWIGSKYKSINFSAEHGCFVKKAGEDHWVNLTEQVDMSWQSRVMELFNSYTERTQGTTIEKKKASLTWHYRRADPDFGAFQASNLRDNLEQMIAPLYDVEVMAGKANIEVRPRQFNKGEIVKHIINDFEEKPDFVMCLGDDATDEDMFRSLSDFKELNGKDGVYAVTIGPPSKKTVASWHLLDPASVLNMLAVITGTD